MAATWWQARGNPRAWRDEAAAPQAHAFHATMPGYAPTPLVSLPGVAEELGVGRVLVKDESSRLGLPAFKILGVSWALARVLAARAGAPMPASWDELCDLASRIPPLELVTATDGNHGRALAHLATKLGLSSRVYVPANVSKAAVEAIANEGAAVERVPDGYDEAVSVAARHAGETPDRLLLQDTAWPGYEEIPRSIVDGYETLFAEIDESTDRVDLVVVPTGVGSLLQAAVSHYRRDQHSPPPAVLAVEPQHAACNLASLQAGRLVTIPTPGTVMAGLDCGTPSALAWPVLASGLDAAVAVPDEDALDAMHDLRGLGVDCGPCGAASLAGLRVVLTGSGADRRRDALGLTSNSTVVLVSTDGRDSGAG